MTDVVVVGSINLDIVTSCARFPQPGETVAGTTIAYGQGGKGANQARAAARAGASVTFIGAVGVAAITVDDRLSIVNCTLAGRTSGYRLRRSACPSARSRSRTHQYSYSSRLRRPRPDDDLGCA